MTTTNESLRQTLSDLADGRADEAQTRVISQAWREQPEVQRDWHAIHLIGDTLRSAELAAQAQRPSALLAQLREQLANEPVPLRRRRWQAWLPPLAVAASFVLVALMVPGLQALLGPRAAPQMAMQQPAVGIFGPTTGSALIGGTPSFAQSVAEPAAGLRTAPPAGQADAVAPFELAVPASAGASR